MQDGFTPDLSKTYIHEGEEYILTGRTAEKTMDPIVEKPRRSTRRQSNHTPQDNDVMVEIKPVQGKSGIRTPITPAPIEKKWVMFSSLYTVSNILEDDKESFMEENNESTNSSY